MKPRNLLRVILFLALCVGTFSTGAQVNAQTATPPPVQIVTRGLSYWDAIYIGNVNSTRYENWPFTLDATYTFTITATATSGDLIPQLTLFDGNGNQISTTINVLTSTQPAGSYSVQIQPFFGSGTYSLTIRQVTSTPTPAPTNTPIFTNTPVATNTPIATNTPVVTSTPVATNTPVFTNTPVSTNTPVATNTPIATNTPVFTNTPTPTFVPSLTPTFTATPTLAVTATPTSTPTTAYVTIVLAPSTIAVGGTSTGTVNLNNVPPSGFASAEFTCTYNQTLASVGNIVATNLFGADPVMVVNGPQNGTFIVAIAGSNGNKATTSGAAFTFTITGLQAGQFSVDCQTRVSTGNLVLTTIPSNPESLTVTSSSTPTTVPTIGTFSGQVNANKLVTVTLFNPDTSVAGSVVANVNGTFSLSVAGGTYTAIASAPGYLKAQGSFTIAGGNTTTAQTVSLLAGDIDGNDVIDQFDALTIGINYNGSTPTAADLNNDGVINVLDMEILAANYHQSGALAWQ